MFSATIAIYIAVPVIVLTREEGAMGKMPLWLMLPRVGQHPALLPGTANDKGHAAERAIRSYPLAALRPLALFLHQQRIRITAATHSGTALSGNGIHGNYIINTRSFLLVRREALFHCGNGSGGTDGQVRNINSLTELRTELRIAK